MLFYFIVTGSFIIIIISIIVFLAYKAFIKADVKEKLDKEKLDREIAEEIEKKHNKYEKVINEKTIDEFLDE